MPKYTPCCEVEPWDLDCEKCCGNGGIKGHECPDCDGCGHQVGRYECPECFSHLDECELEPEGYDA